MSMVPGREMILPWDRREVQESDEVYDQAVAQNVKLVARHHVKARVRCNQPVGTRDGAQCDFDRWIESPAIEVADRAVAILREHWFHAHPAFSVEQIDRLAARTWKMLRDI